MHSGEGQTPPAQKAGWNGMGSGRTQDHIWGVPSVYGRPYHKNTLPRLKYVDPEH